jgi:LDH2 family malate/lactate/ureidoglycolate dehydrogenase
VTSADTTERVHLSVAEARALSERAMRGIGYEAEEARILADHVIDAALCGYFDGGNQSGMLGRYYATRAVIERAHVHGFALVGVNNLWMSGRSARAALGTNPIAFGFPMEGDPLVIDLQSREPRSARCTRSHNGAPLPIESPRCELILRALHRVESSDAPPRNSCRISDRRRGPCSGPTSV